MGFILNPYRFASSGDGPPVAGPEVWWDASDETTITTSGNAVTQMTDKSGNGYTLTPRSTGPDSGTRTINSLNVLDFGGSPELLEATTASSLINQDGTFTMFVVAEYDTGSNGAFIAEGATTNATVRSVYRCSGAPGNLRAEAFTTGGASNIYDDGALSANPVLITATGSGGTHEIGLDGASRTVDSSVVSSAGVNRIGLGAFPRSSPAYYFDGAVAEVLIYASQLSSGDIGAVESYLATKWGITI